MNKYRAPRGMEIVLRLRLRYYSGHLLYLSLFRFLTAYAQPRFCRIMQPREAPSLNRFERSRSFLLRGELRQQLCEF